MKTKTGTAVRALTFAWRDLLNRFRPIGQAIDCFGARDLELARGWRLLFLVLAAVRLVPLLHGLALLRGQERFHLLVRVLMDATDFGLLLIGAQRRIVIHGRDLRLRVLVDFLHLRFLIIGQVEIRARPLRLICRSGLGLSSILRESRGAGEHR
jgi:hypothetical protein